MGQKKKGEMRMCSFKSMNWWPKDLPQDAGEIVLLESLSRPVTKKTQFYSDFRIMIVRKVLALESFSTITYEYPRE